MTREEAIEVITDYLNKDTAISPYNSRFINALNMAIEALQTKGVGRYENAMQKLREMPRYLSGVKEKRKAEPVKHGKWINKQKPNINYIPPYNCSECGGAGYGTDYCPNCGAKMDKK